MRSTDKNQMLISYSTEHIEGSPCISSLKLLRFIASLKLLTTFLILAIYVMMNKGDCKVQTFMSIRWYIPKSSKERL